MLFTRYRLVASASSHSGEPCRTARAPSGTGRSGRLTVHRISSEVPRPTSSSWMPFGLSPTILPAKDSKRTASRKRLALGPLEAHRALELDPSPAQRTPHPRGREPGCGAIARHVSLLSRSRYPAGVCLVSGPTEASLTRSGSLIEEVLSPGRVPRGRWVMPPTTLGSHGPEGAPTREALVRGDLVGQRPDCPSGGDPTGRSAIQPGTRDDLRPYRPSPRPAKTGGGRGRWLPCVGGGCAAAAAVLLVSGCTSLSDGALGSDPGPARTPSPSWTPGTVVPAVATCADGTTPGRPRRADQPSPIGPAAIDAQSGQLVVVSSFWDRPDHELRRVHQHLGVSQAARRGRR